MKWISVKDQPAPIKGRILVWSDYCKSVHTAGYDYDERINEECCYEDSSHHPGSPITNITHWMNLPPKPGEAQERCESTAKKDKE